MFEDFPIYSNGTKPGALHCHVKALNYLGKRPGIIVPDSAPTATYRPVKNKPGRRIQERYADFADYYDILLVPARPGKPRDKTAVERAVQLVYTRILGYFDGPARFLAFLQPLEGVVTFVSCFLLLPW